MSAKTKNEMLFSEFPLPEYLHRYERLIAYGKDQNIDAFIFTDEENLRYFAGGPLTDAFLFRPDSMAVIITTAREKPPRFVLSRTKVNAVHSSWIKDRYFWGDIGIESAGDITVEAMVNSIRDLSLDRGTIAMEISGNEKLFMSVSVYDSIRKQLPEMSIVSCFSAVSTVRGIDGKRAQSKRGSDGADKPESEDIGSKEDPQDERPQSVIKSLGFSAWNAVGGRAHGDLPEQIHPVQQPEKRAEGASHEKKVVHAGHLPTPMDYRRRR